MDKDKNMIFFFDESFHSRKINEKTIENQEYFDSYVITGLGCNENDLENEQKSYDNFEKKFKNIFSIPDSDELKSKIVKKEQYRYGLKSFNTKSFELYMDFWNLMNKSNLVYYVCVISKLEYILSQFDYQIIGIRNYVSVIYSIVKAVNVYRPQQVLDCLFNESEQLLEELINFFKRKIEENIENPIKIHENASFYENMIILKKINEKKIELKWNYNTIFIGFRKLVNEIKIKDVRIIIDKEGNPKENTAKACIEEGFKKVEEIDSNESFILRCTDMFCGFISKMMRAIYEDTKTSDVEEYKEKKILNQNWFNINEQQFLLYKEIANYFKKYSSYYWCTFISIYFDSFLQFIDLIYYFDGFENFTEYNKISSNEHREKYNSFLISEINKKFIQYGWMK